MKHAPACLIYLCTCVVNEECPVCTPAGRGVLCETHRNQVNKAYGLMDEPIPQTTDEHEAGGIGA